MAERSDLSGRERLLDEVATAYLKAIEAGEAPDRDEWLARYSEVGADLEAFFADQEALARLAGPLRAVARAARGEAPVPGPGAPEGSPQLPTSGTLGDFRILGEVGHGGMGVVYEAEQISLGRRVALKVLPFAATMDPRQLQRFHNEARAAACLDHPHIVKVHAVGQERGVHYYAMQFIDGQTLADLIAALRGQAISS